MCKTIIIKTTEQAEAYMAYLQNLKSKAREDNYKSERKKPIKRMTCTCCGKKYKGRQWWNQDCGYGLGDCCVKYCGVDPTPGKESESYGVPGIHFLINKKTE